MQINAYVKQDKGIYKLEVMHTSIKPSLRKEQPSKYKSIFMRVLSVWIEFCVQGDQNKHCSGNSHIQGVYVKITFISRSAGEVNTCKKVEKGIF